MQIFDVIIFFKLRTIQQKTVKPTYLCPLGARKLAEGKGHETASESKSCKSCDYWNKQNENTQHYRDWQAKHINNCTMSHEGSSGSMESDMAVKLFSRSVEQYNLMYTKFVGDGDKIVSKKSLTQMCMVMSTWFRKSNVWVIGKNVWAPDCVT